MKRSSLEAPLQGGALLIEATLRTIRLTVAVCAFQECSHLCKSLRELACLTAAIRSMAKKGRQECPDSARPPKE
jgi:hypothetical protein